VKENFIITENPNDYLFYEDIRRIAESRSRTFQEKDWKELQKSISKIDTIEKKKRRKDGRSNPQWGFEGIKPKDFDY
jgi:hypothetical protein